MFHHRSCGTMRLVALMAAHRAARENHTGLRQGEIARVIDRLDMAGGEQERPPRRPRWTSTKPPRAR